jgi:ABC-type phosphate/phosphonate transport system substrate-binding protein
MLQERKITGYFGSPLLLVRHQHAFNLNALYTPMLNNAVLQRYVLLVRKDSAINHLSDLKDKSLSYCVVDEVGMMYLQKSLNDQKLGDIHAFFNKTIIKKNPNLAVSALFFKEVQATVVLEADFMVAAELNPQLKQQLVSIQMSPEYVTNVLAISNRLDGPMSIAEYENNVLHIGSAIQSKKLLKTYNYGKLRKIKKEDLDTVVELIHSLYPTKGTTSR